MYGKSDWGVHVLRREEEHMFRKVSEFRVEGLRRPRKTWIRQVEEEESRKAGLVKKDAQNGKRECI